MLGLALAADVFLEQAPMRVREQPNSASPALMGKVLSLVSLEIQM